MSKNSVRAKGYRKDSKKTSGYTESEKKIMTIGFLVIVLIIVGVLVLPDWIESLSLLKVKDGVVQGVEDNWLICNLGTNSSPKYRKLAVVEPAAGFEMTDTSYISDANAPYLIFTPTGDAAAQTILIQAGNGDAETLANKYATSIHTLAEVLYQDDVVQETIDGKQTWSSVVEYRMQNPSDDSSADPTYSYTQSAVLYIDSPISGRSVVITASNEGDSEAVFGDRAALLEIAKSAVAGVELAK